MLKGTIIPVGNYQNSLQFGKTPELDNNTILKIHNKNYPDFRFEWHPGVQKLYVIRVMKDKEGRPLPSQHGELVAFNIENQGQAQNSVLIWCRGYQCAANDRERVPFLKAEDY
jgi:hypothetical protein